uniref:Uncharacterized protein n=1 Tax=Salix viminalis TaxID=40686 RepID=A0A6N2LLC1_SALVM
MISNPNHVFYACIAKGPTVLAEFSSSNESGIEIIGQRCIEKTPPNHSISESLWFLNRVKDAFEDFLGAKMMKDEKMGSFCFQGELRFMFREILALDADLVNALMEESTKDSRNPSLDSTKAKGAKKKRSPGEANGDHHGGDLDNNKASGAGENGSREFSVTMMQKSGGFYTGDDAFEKQHLLIAVSACPILSLDKIILKCPYLWDPTSHNTPKTLEKSSDKFAAAMTF